MNRPAWLPLGALLVREGLITPEQLELGLLEQEQDGRRLGEILVGWGWVSSREIARALAEQYGLEFFDLASFEIDEEVAVLLREKLARRYDALPIAVVADGLVVVAIADPTNVSIADELRIALRSSIRLVVVDKVDLDVAFERAFGAPVAPFA